MKTKDINRNLKTPIINEIKQLLNKHCFGQIMFSNGGFYCNGSQIEYISTEGIADGFWDKVFTLNELSIQSLNTVLEQVKIYIQN